MIYGYQRKTGSSVLSFFCQIKSKEVWMWPIIPPCLWTFEASVKKFGSLCFSAAIFAVKDWVNWMDALDFRLKWMLVSAVI